MEFETAAPVQSGNSDVLPFIERLGVRPAALRSYDDNTLVRDAQGLAVTFRFNEKLSVGEGAEVATYCAAAFNLMGFKAAEPAMGVYTANSVRVHFAPEGIPGEDRVKQKRYEYQVDEIVKIDSVGPLWLALRTIRQAAALG